MTVFHRLAKAWDAYKGIPFPGTNSSTVQMFSSFDAWDRARLPQTGQKDYSVLVGDLSMSSLVIAAVRWLGNRLPEPPPQVRKDINSQEDDSLISDHPLTALLTRPNPYFEGSTLWKGVAYDWITSDQAYLLKLRKNNGQVYQLWYEPSENVRVRWPQDGSQFISNYEIKRGSQWYPVPIEDIVHFRNGIDPANTRFALPSMPSLFREIYGDNQTADFYADLTGGSGVPPFVATINNKGGALALTEDDAKQIKSRLMEQTRPGSKGDPLVVENLDIKKLAWSPAEMDLRVGRYLAEERFCAVTGIPAICLELGSGQEHSIYNNVKQAESRAAESYLVPLWKHFAEVLTYQLLPDFDQDPKTFVTFDLSKVQSLQEDEDSKHKRIGEDYKNGAIDRAEYRAGIGRQARPEDQGVYYSTSPALPEPPALPAKSLTPKASQEMKEWLENLGVPGVIDLLTADA